MVDPSSKVSVIVITHNSMPVLADCLQALRGAIESVPSELVVVDNASTDDSVDEVRRLFPNATVVSNERNVGFAAGCNLGARAASGEILFFLNPDVSVDCDTVIRLVDALEGRDEIGLASGRLRNPDGSFQATCRRFPTINNLIFSRGSWLTRYRERSGVKQPRYTLPDYDETTEVPAVAATMVMIHKSVFEVVGGFDRRFFMYMEDTDLSLRVQRAGFRNLFVPAAGGIHAWGKGSSVGQLRRSWHHHYSMWQYFLKHFPNGFSVVVLPVLLGANLLMLLIMPEKEKKSQ